MYIRVAFTVLSAAAAVLSCSVSLRNYMLCVCKRLKLNRINFAYATIHCLIVHVVYALLSLKIFFIRMQVKSARSATHTHMRTCKGAFIVMK